MNKIFEGIGKRPPTGKTTPTRKIIREKNM